MTSPWITVDETIVYLRREKVKTAREQVLRLFRTGKIRSNKDGIKYLTKIEWIDAYLAKKGIEGGI